jgi:electron transport complex protein RnfE
MNQFNNFTKGFFKENPILVLVLGTCPTLATTSSSLNGMGMGIATTFVLVGSNVVISMLADLIPDKVRIPAFVVIIASFVTIAYCS